MKHFVSTLALVTLLAACSENALPTAPSAAFDRALDVARASSDMTNLREPTDLFVWVECANDGAGEVVLLSGPLHIIVHTTLDARGGAHLKLHFQPQGISGTGQTTGDRYQATGVTQEHLNLKKGETYTRVNNFRMIGQGPGNNFLVHETFHVTINANGVLTAWVDNFTVECK